MTLPSSSPVIAHRQKWRWNPAFHLRQGFGGHGRTGWHWRSPPWHESFARGANRPRAGIISVFVYPENASGGRVPPFHQATLISPIVLARPAAWLKSRPETANIATKMPFRKKTGTTPGLKSDGQQTR